VTGEVVSLSAAVRHLPCGILIVDEAGTIELANQTVHRYFGYAPGELVGHSVDELVPERYRGHHPELRGGFVSELGHRGMGDGRAVWGVRRDGTEFRCELGLTPVVQGTRRRVVAAVVDVSEAVEQAKSAQLSDKIIKTMPSGVCLVRCADATVVYANPRFETMFGYGPGELEGTAVQRLNYAGDGTDSLEKAKRIIDELAATGEAVYEVRNVRKDGTPFWCQAHTSELDHPEYGLVWVAVHSDITERKRLEEAVRHTQKMEAVGTLAGEIAHDLNNVLATVIGMASVIENELPPEHDNLPDLRGIIDAANDGKSLISNILGFARRGAYQSAPFGFDEQVQATVDLLRRTIPRRVELRATFGAAGAVVLGDASQLKQALVNVCLNAADAIDGSGTIGIVTRLVDLDASEAGAGGLKAGKHLTVTVTDDGGGMSAAAIARAFEPFFTTKPIGRGTGLGLAMAYGVLQNHGGAIRLESQLGVGTVVTLTLPQSDAKPAPKKRAELTSGSGRVLVVDDEPLVRRTLGRMLKVIGYDVTLADGGSEGIRVFEGAESPFDVVLLDLSMPGMGGAECFKRLRSIDPSVSVIVSTGHGDPRDTEAMLRAGAVQVLVKPYAVDALSRALADACASS